MKIKQQRTKRQHTVPRSHLERFLPPGGNTLWVFDKVKKNTYETTLPNIAVENGFYDIPSNFTDPRYPREEYDYQFLEHGLGEKEGQFKQDLDAFLAEV